MVALAYNVRYIVTMENTEDAPLGGVWLVYGWDYGPYAVSVHQTEAEAREAANFGSADLPWEHVCFWSFGTDLGDTVRAWEKGRPDEGRS